MKKDHQDLLSKNLFLQQSTTQMELKFKNEMLQRKKLHNQLEDMKGKIRVYCRVRPFSKSEKAEAERAIPCYKILDENNIDIGVTKNKTKCYTFDSVFGVDSTQDEVFEETKRLI